MNELAAALGEEPGAPSLQRKSSAVYHAIRRAILLHRMAPGQTLLEQQIAATMRCSQGTVREALLRLEQDGLVERRGYRGTFVSDTSEAEAALMARVRIEIEARGARLAAERASEGDLLHLGDILAQMAAAEKRRDGYAMSELDRSFHLAILRLAGLSALEPILTRCSLHVHRFIYARGPQGTTPDNRRGLPSGAELHRELLKVLESGDGAAAARAMRQHIERVIGSWAPALLPRILEGSGSPA